MIVRKPENCESNKIEYHGEVVSPTRRKKAGDRKIERKIQRRGFVVIDSEKQHTTNHPLRTTINLCIGKRNSR